MPGFSDVTLSWGGEDFTIPANRVMGAIARVEDVVTLVELHRHSERGTMPMAKLAMAFGGVLRYAGAKVTDDEVYQGMFADGGASIPAAIGTLLAMMTPPAAISKRAVSAGPGAGGNERPAAARSSRKRSSSRSARGG